MDRHRATTECLSLSTAAFSLLVGGLWMGRPSFWLRRQLNPYSPAVVFERRSDAAAYRLDMLSQNLLRRPMFRDRWIRALLREEHAPSGTVEPVTEVADEVEFMAARGTHRPMVLRRYMQRSADWRDWSLEAFLAGYGDEEDLLCCPVRDGYPGRVREIVVPGVYLHNTQILLQRDPELLRRTGFELLPRTLARGLLFSGVAQLMVGRGPSGSFWHCAGGLNLFCMLAGTKKWTFIDPGESPFLLPLTDGPGRSSYYRSGHGASSDLFDDYLALLGSEVERDAARERVFARATRYEVELDPGDVLLSPPWWWHDVRNTSEDTIGLATRWLDLKAARIQNPVFDAAMRTNWGLTRVYTREAYGQRLVGRDGTCHFERSRVPREQQPGALAHRVRGGAIAQWLDLDPDVDAYYRQMGFERASFA